MGGATNNSGWASRTALITSSNLAEMARLCGLVPLLASEGEEWPAADILIADLRSEPNALLDSVVEYLEKRPIPVLAWANLRDVEAAFATLAHAEPYWLVDGNEYEALAMLATIAHQPKPSAVHGNNHAPDYAALHRMSDELANFAHLLANIAGKNSGAVPPASRPPLTRTSGASGSAAPLDPADIRAIIRERRLRDAYFQPGLFADPAWDILLDLMAARLEYQSVSVSSLCIAAAVPPTTALRCITGMTRGGLLERSADPGDARRIFITMSPDTENAMRHYLAETLRPREG